jgi:hypothetical protein
MDSQQACLLELDRCCYQNPQKPHLQGIQAVSKQSQCAAAKMTMADGERCWVCYMLE